MVARLNRDSPLPEVGIVRVQDGVTQRALDALRTPLEFTVRFLQGFIQPEPWKALPFLSGWRDYTGTLDTWQVSGYRKDPLGRVHLRGLVERYSGATTQIAVLPTGYRPARQKLFPVAGSGGAGRIDVMVDGTVLYNSGGVGYLTLEGVSFDTES